MAQKKPGRGKTAVKKPRRRTRSAQQPRGRQRRSVSRGSAFPQGLGTWFRQLSLDRAHLGLVVAVAVIIFASGYAAYANYQTRTDLATGFEPVNIRLSDLDTRYASLEDDHAELRPQVVATSERLGVTEKSLAGVWARTRQVRRDHRRATQELNNGLEEQQGQMGLLTTELGQVNSTVEETERALEVTELQLQRAMGDLGVLSGLIATNAQELELLRGLGNREYYEFDLRKSGDYSRVGTVALRLNKTDTKRQKYTLTLLSDDKQIEKKDKTLLEPVQFYLRGTRHLLEIVVYEVAKNRIVGYLSVPKSVAATR